MDCIDLFKRAAMALQTDPRYVILDQARKANDKDEELQNLIGEFNLARMDLNNEIGKNERDDARIAELNEKVNSLYGQIMGNEGMVAYNEAKRECENLVNYIDAIINTAMNGGDPMTVQEPSASCTGSCSTDQFPGIGFYRIPFRYEKTAEVYASFALSVLGSGRVYAGGERTTCRRGDRTGAIPHYFEEMGAGR